MVVHHVADSMPTYVVRNDRSGGEIVLNQVPLLLWITDCTNQDDGVSVNLAIAVPMIVGSVEEGQIVNGDESHVMSYGLSLTMFKMSLSPLSQMMGIEAQVIPAGVLQKGVGHVTTAHKGYIPPMAGDTMLVEDVPA